MAIDEFVKQWNDYSSSCNYPISNEAFSNGGLPEMYNFDKLAVPNNSSSLIDK